MSPNGGGHPSGDLADAINTTFDLLKICAFFLMQRPLSLVQVGLGYVKEGC